MITVAQSAWIARIRSHTYINTATTTWCEAPAQLLQNLESNCTCTCIHVRVWVHILGGPQECSAEERYINNNITICMCRISRLTHP